MTDQERIRQMRVIWGHVLRDAEKVRQGGASEWTAERVRRARFEKPWLTQSYVTESGEVLNAGFGDAKTREISWAEQTQRFNQSIPHLFDVASLARDKANSYRNFNVGVALLAFRRGYSNDKAWQVFPGMNYKAIQETRPVCGEPIAVQSAIAAGFDYGTGMVVVGEPREEDPDPTLHPCEFCRPMLFHSEPFISTNFHVWCITPDGRLYQRFTLWELLQHHGEIPA